MDDRAVEFSFKMFNNDAGELIARRIFIEEKDGVLQYTLQLEIPETTRFTFTNGEHIQDFKNAISKLMWEI